MKARFLQICRDVASSKERAYVRDKAGVYYMTISAVRPSGDLRPIQVSPQRFKDNFARFSSLVRDGFVFALVVRRGGELVYARRHTKYVDPLHDVIAECFSMLRGLGPEPSTQGDDEDGVDV